MKIDEMDKLVNIVPYDGNLIAVPVNSMPGDNVKLFLQAILDGPHPDVRHILWNGRVHKYAVTTETKIVVTSFRLEQ